jgi:hypothetical protein
MGSAVSIVNRHAVEKELTPATQMDADEERWQSPKSGAPPDAWSWLDWIDYSSGFLSAFIRVHLRLNCIVPAQVGSQSQAVPGQSMRRRRGVPRRAEPICWIADW